MKNLITKSAKIITVSALSAVFWVGTSHAAFVLSIDDLNDAAAPTLIFDSFPGNVIPGDESPLIEGLITKTIVTADFTIIATIGTSKPIGGNSPTFALMDLFNLDISSTKAADLVIKLTDTDFNLSGVSGLGLGQMFANVGGTLGNDPTNSLQIDYFFDSTNTQFGTPAGSKLSSGTWNTGAFSEALGGLSVSPVNAPFSLTQVATIHIGNGTGFGQTISYDSELTVVPEPSILFLMGLGLIGLTVVNRRKG